MTSELKPCPFCGGTRATITSECDIDTEGKFYRVECLDCRAKTKEHYARETCPIFYESVRNDWNTRATPSTDTLAGLVRYEANSPNAPAGGYVLYSEAAAVVAEVVADRDSWRRTAERCKSECNAAEAELDKLKAQEPVGWFHFCISTGEYTAEWCRVKPYDHHGFRPLYAAPVSDSLKGENERLRVRLNAAADDFELIQQRINDGQHDRAGATAYQGEKEARAALNVEASNDKG